MSGKRKVKTVPQGTKPTTATVSIRGKEYRFRVGNRMPLRHKLRLTRFFADVDLSDSGAVTELIVDRFEEYAAIVSKATGIPLEVAEDFDEEQFAAVQRALFPTGGEDPRPAGPAIKAEEPAE